MLERTFQHKLIREIERRFPGSIVLKQDARQGLPDLVIFYGKNWAMLECKESATAPHQPNQDYYVRLFDSFSFCRFVFPENVEEVLYDLECAFES